MTQLMSSTFNLTLGDLIVARVKASNVKGFGPYSPVNIIGAVIQSKPLAPINGPRRLAGSNEVRL